MHVRAVTSCSSQSVTSWRASQLQERIASTYALKNRIFIAGEACHSLRPKVGDGMNLSLHDAYDLVMRISAVLKGEAPQASLSAYEEQRRAVAVQMQAEDAGLADFQL